MMFVKVVPCGVVVELDATDCLQLADALGYSEHRDIPGNRIHVNALRAALTACAVLAAHDTNTDVDTPEDQLLAETRRVWGPRDTRWLAGERVLEPPK